ncbi:MAG: F0F1 ATP synthase subunit A [Polyangiaceae bacterium]
MPKHTTWLTYLIAQIEGFGSNKHPKPEDMPLKPSTLGDGILGKSLLDPPDPAHLKPHYDWQPTWHSFEPIITSLVYIVIFVVLALMARSKLKDAKASVVPGDRFTLTTVFEVFFGYFYTLTKDVMGQERARQHFPLIGASAAFIIFSNLMGLIPGFGSPTSNLNITFGCAVVVFLVFNYHGFRVNGLAYLAHMAGPKWYLAPLIFTIEVISTFMRVLTLSIRLMVNIAVDHLLASTFIGLIAIFVPVPVALLGILVCLVQGLVFSLLTAVYIALATEDMHAEHH